MTEACPSRYRGDVFAEPKDGKPAPAPSGVSAYPLDVPGDDLVLFVWDAEDSPTPLAAGEREVLRLVLEGRSNAEIAAARGTSARTVANQVASLLRKLGARSRFDLIGRMGRDQAVKTSEPPPKAPARKAKSTRQR